MVKGYIVGYTIFLICLGVYIYRGDGSKEHRKNIIIIGIIGILHAYLFIFFMVMKPEIKSFIAQMKSKENISADEKRQESLYGEGYLKVGALWVDKNGIKYRNAEYTKVEISKGKIVMADGNETKPFEFLEGENIGVWGYTSENSFTVNPQIVSASKSEGVERIIRASPQRSCTCVVNVEDIDTVMDAVKMKDELLYGLFVNLGTVIIVREDTRVSCYFSESYRGFVPVVFFEGEYKGRRVYVPEKRLQEQ